jgi:replicative DNA helicase
MDKTRLETTILKNLILSDEYSRKVLPFVKDEYFSEPDEQVVYKEVVSYFEKYNKSPTVEALLINLDNNTSLSDGVLKQSKSIVKDFTSSDTSAIEWLVDETEKWCKDRAIYIAVMNSIDVLDEKNQRSRGEIPELL